MASLLFHNKAPADRPAPICYRISGPIRKIEFAESKKTVIFALRKDGSMAEWLGRGLQNLVQRFESASNLKSTLYKNKVLFYFLPIREPRGCYLGHPIPQKPTNGIPCFTRILLAYKQFRNTNSI